jgi:aspartate racemase
MEEDFYRDRPGKRFGIDVFVPPDEEQNTVDRIIYEELCQGKIIDTSRRACLNIIEGLKWRGAEGVVPGCTEFDNFLVFQEFQRKLKLIISAK